MSNEVTFEEFSKIDMKIGKIIDAQLVPGSKKLLKLQIDVGGQKKQSIAAIGDQYTIESIIAKLVVIVTNLKPRKIVGQDSEVMLLAALDNRVVSILQPDKIVNAGSKVG